MLEAARIEAFRIGAADLQAGVDERAASARHGAAGPGHQVGDDEIAGAAQGSGGENELRGRGGAVENDRARGVDLSKAGDAVGAGQGEVCRAAEGNRAGSGDARIRTEGEGSGNKVKGRAGLNRVSAEYGTRACAAADAIQNTGLHIDRIAAVTGVERCRCEG